MNKIFAADYSKGFGGKYGVQKDRVDKSAVGWDHQEQLGKHESQIGISSIEVPVCFILDSLALVHVVMPLVLFCRDMPSFC